MNIDLHCHSTASDGLLKPGELVARAAANGVEVLALTDHDDLSGLAEARAKAESEGVRFVDGVEISVTWEGSTVHIVGLQIDPEDPVLRSGLESVRAGRARRAEKMGEALDAAVSWIRASGGIAVVAHPGRYKFPKPERHAFLAEFRDCGGAGIEVVTGSHSPEQYLEFARVARELGLSASRGSDYHGKGESKAELGALPQLPDDLSPVWREW